MQQQPTTDLIEFPSEDSSDLLTPILREGAQKMLATAIELEAREWIEARATLRDDEDHRLVVRNGYQPTRTIQTGVGDVEVRQRSWRSRRPGV